MILDSGLLFWGPPCITNSGHVRCRYGVIALCYCSQSEAIELQKELQKEYGYSLAQLTEVAGLGSASAIVKARIALLFAVSCRLCV